MKYTKSAFLSMFDFIKKIIYSFDLLVQVGYIGYLSYRVFKSIGINITNIILLIISVSYLIYHILSTKEFYTQEQKENKKKIKLIFKILKRIINVIVIIISIYQLLNITYISNIDILFTMLLILGFIISIIGDLLFIVINTKITIVYNSIKYDINIFKEEHPIIMSKPYEFINSKMSLKVTQDTIEKIKKMNYHQEMKGRRKRDFFKK